MTIIEFMKLFPDDDACLEHLFKGRFNDRACPRCGDYGMYKRITNRPVWSCSCGEHFSPMAGTMFHRSHTPLQKWFYAMYLFTTTRHGVPAKELQRQLSVNYKTAYRMGMQIRKYLAYVDGDPPLGGHVEIDETLVGGKHKGGKQGRHAETKTIVLGMVARNGDVITRVIPNVARKTLEAHIIKHVKRDATVTTDELASYKRLWMYGYDHQSVNHAAKEYVREDRHTNTIEGFWSIIKRSIRGTHVHVSSHRLPIYLGEFEFRWNLRRHPEKMFPVLLKGLSLPLPEALQTDRHPLR
jgi:transposase-like protein